LLFSRERPPRKPEPQLHKLMPEISVQVKINNRLVPVCLA
jgi:hypothetical protein